jgi:RimJ/RimL family protein N-acetyltransferase
MRDAIYMQSKNYLIHSFGPEEIANIEALANHVYMILSDAVTLKFLSRKRLHSVEEAKELLKNNVLSFHAGRNYLHFITDKTSANVVGMINLISPETAKEHYSFTEYPYFIEFYLSGQQTGKSVMSTLLPLFVAALRNRNINQVGAIAHRDNIGSKKVLEKSGFVYNGAFDTTQDYYKINLITK